MSKWKIIVSIVLVVAGLVYAAVQSWTVCLSMLLISVVMAALFMLTRKQGGDLFINIAYGAIVSYLLLGIVFGAYTTFNSVPQYLELSKYSWANLILLVVNNSIPSILILLGNIFPLIYCLTAKRETKEKSVG